MVTIREVGARAGVSTSTVSNVLNGRGQVAEATRKKVLEAVRELGYAANIHAQQLVTQRSRIIGIKLPHLKDADSDGIPDSSYFLNIINGATDAASDLGHALVIVPSKAKSHSLRQFGIDGFIVVDPTEDEELFQVDIPAVAIGAPKQLRGAVGIVDNDHRAGLHIALAKFKADGRKKHAVVTDNTMRSYTEDIEMAYVEWAAANDDLATVLRLPALTESHLCELLNQIQNLDIDSVYTVSDDIAVALLKYSQAHNTEVPEKLSVISAVNSTMLTVTTPSISAVELFPLETGRAAARLLISTLNGNSDPEPEIAIPVDFVERESTSVKN